MKPTKDVFEPIDKIRRRFLWAGDKALSGGKCKINWTKMTLPKEFGGLGILNLYSFATALRLRWLGHKWTSPEKAWVGTEVPCIESDRLLFTACTTTFLGNGQKTPCYKLRCEEGNCEDWGLVCGELGLRATVPAVLQ
jgi:hypothetical protein